LIISTGVNAALISRDITVSVTDTDHSLISVAEEFTITSVYDDESTQANSFNDGLNGIAENGLGDDTLRFTICTVAGLGCPSPQSGYTFIGDATLTGNIFSKPTGSESDYDEFSFNSSYVWNGFGYFTFQIYSDDMYFQLDLNPDLSSGLGYMKTNGGQGDDYFTSFTVTDVANAMLPEPSILAIMGVGILSLGLSRRKLKK
jgi:hypothetical protein